MANGDLCIIADVENWANVASSATTDAIVAGLITAVSDFLANHLNRDLMSLGGAGMAQVSSVGEDAGGTYISLKAPIAAVPAAGAAIVDFTKPSADAVQTPAASALNSTTKLYVASGGNFSVNDFINVLAPMPYLETYDGLGGDKLELHEWPIVAVNSLSVAGSPIAASSGPMAAGYTFSQPKVGPGHVQLIGYWFPRFPASVVSGYSAGYLGVPASLGQVAKELCGTRLKARARQGAASKNIAGESISFSIKDLPDDLAIMLKPFHRTMPRWN